MKNILITGGCGYVGSRLVPYLLAKGYNIKVLDSLIFGNKLKNFNFELITGDIRDNDMLHKATKDIDTIIHLAAISNDPTSDLDPTITNEVNYEAIKELAKIAKQNKVKRMILASSSTLYGFNKDDEYLSEDNEINPITLYGKLKAKSEREVFDMADDKFTVSALRPGTVAGFSLRQRFDLIVNIFTRDAINNQVLTIEGGKQKRPIISMFDMCRAYELMIFADKELINKQAFNVVEANLTIEDIAQKVAEVIPDIEIKYIDKIDDRRSYFTSNKKIRTVLGFVPKFSIIDAINELKNKMLEGFFKDSINNPEYYNIKQLKRIINNISN